MSKKLNTKAFDTTLSVTLPKPPVRTPVPEPEAERFLVEEAAPSPARTPVLKPEAEHSVNEAPPPAEAVDKPKPAAASRAVPARAPRPVAAKVPAPAAAAPASRLRRDESGERVVAYVPTELATDLRVTCARSRRSMSDAVTEALTMWLSAQSTKLPKCRVAK
jgi:hypothetical protein